MEIFPLIKEYWTQILWVLNAFGVALLFILRNIVFTGLSWLWKKVKAIAKRKPPFDPPLGVDDFYQTIIENGAMRAPKNTLVHAIGGSGKSLLAKFTEHNSQKKYEQVFYIDLMGHTANPVLPADALAQFIKKLNKRDEEPTGNEIARHNQLKRMLENTKALFILDDARDAEHVKLLIPDAPHFTIITSRTVFELDNVISYELPKMTREISLKLLNKVMDKRKITPTEADNIAELCYDLPLAIKIYGGFLNESDDWTIEEFIAYFSKDHADIKQEEGDDPRSLVLSRLAHSEKLLRLKQPLLADFWAELSIFPSKFDDEMCSKIWGEPAKTLKMKLSELKRRHMLEYDVTTKKYYLHGFMWDIADGLASDKTEARFEELRLNHAKYFKEVFAKANSNYMMRSYSKDAALYHLEEQNIKMAILRAGVRLDNETWANMLLECCDVGKDLIKDYYSNQEKLVLFERALIVARKKNLQEKMGNYLLDIAKLKSVVGGLDEALKLELEALDIFIAIESYEGELKTLIAIINSYINLGYSENALDYSNMITEKTIVKPNKKHEMKNFRLRSNIFYYKNMLADALNSSRKAYELSLELNDQDQIIYSLHNLAKNYIHNNIYHIAKEKLEEAKLLIHENDLEELRANDFYMGWLYGKIGDQQRAIQHYEKCLFYDQSIGAIDDQSSTLNNIGTCYSKMNNEGKALNYYVKALTLSRKSNSKVYQMIDLMNISTTYENLKLIPNAIIHCKEAIEIAHEVKSYRIEELKSLLERLEKQLPTPQGFP